jgi:hypothetical protein
MTSFQGVRFNSLQVGAKTQYEFIYLYNLTSLGLASLTKAQLDYLFTVWQFNNANAVVARQFIQTANIDTVAYGGLSYREIFEDGQLVTNGDVGWVANTYAYLSPVTLNLTTNDKIYLRYTQETLSGDNINAAGRWTLFNLSTFNNIVSSQYNNGTYSYLHTAIRTANELLYTYGNQSVGGQIKYNNIFIINLTDLFGAGNEPNQATMDTLYQEYITLKGGLQ